MWRQFCEQGCYRRRLENGQVSDYSRPSGPQKHLRLYSKRQGKLREDFEQGLRDKTCAPTFLF